MTWKHGENKVSNEHNVKIAMEIDRHNRSWNGKKYTYEYTHDKKKKEMAKKMKKV